jgi:hypothetical protein
MWAKMGGTIDVGLRTIEGRERKMWWKKEEEERDASSYTSRVGH